MKLISKKIPEKIEYLYTIQFNQEELETICSSVHGSVRDCKNTYDELKQAHNDNMLARIAHEQKLSDDLNRILLLE